MSDARSTFKPYLDGRYVIQHKPTAMNDWYKGRDWHDGENSFDDRRDALDTLKSWTGASREFFEWRVYDKNTGKAFADPSAP